MYEEGRVKPIEINPPIYISMDIETTLPLGYGKEFMKN